MSIVYIVKASKYFANGKIETLERSYQGSSLDDATVAYDAYRKPSNVRARVVVGLSEWEDVGDGFLKHKLHASLSIRREA
jgi:hypothetical protein